MGDKGIIESRRRAGGLGLALFAIVAALTVSLLLLFYHIRVSIKPYRFPHSIFDAEQKDDTRGPGLDLWEVIICSLVPFLLWRYQWQCKNLLQRTTNNKLFSTILFSTIAAFWFLGLYKLLFSPSHQCNGWMETDVGYIHGHSNYGVSIRTLCSGGVWEPHVARAIDQHLYGQGRAIDVGAFVGYHTVHLAKQAAPLNVYAFEGRVNADLKNNLKRNNAKNVQVISETIDKNWRIDSILEKDLLDDNKGPIAFIKIDCEGCELHFLKGARDVVEKWHPVLVVEIQDNNSRRNAVIEGQRMIKPTDTREDVLDYLKMLGYNNIEALNDRDGIPTWDYLAFQM